MFDSDCESGREYSKRNEEQRLQIYERGTCIEYMLLTMLHGAVGTTAIILLIHFDRHKLSVGVFRFVYPDINLSLSLPLSRCLDLEVGIPSHSSSAPRPAILLVINPRSHPHLRVPVGNSFVALPMRIVRGACPTGLTILAVIGM